MKLIQRVQSIFFGCLMAVAFLGVLIATDARTVQAAEYPLTGWAWSSNIGWISLNSSNSGAGGSTYGVRVNDDGVFSGYAWAPTVGWLSFNDSETAGCGDSTLATCAPRLTFETGRISGWARFINGIGRTDGWNGWVKLSDSEFFQSPGYQGNLGFTYNNSNRTFTGYSWGAPATGWINWNGVACPTCPQTTETEQSCMLETVPAVTTVVPRTVTVNWYSNPGSTCIGSGFSTGNSAEGSANISVNGDTQLSVNCTNAANTASKQCFAFVDYQQDPTIPPPPTPTPNYRLDATSGSLRATSPGSLSIQAGSAVTLTVLKTNTGNFAECTLTNSADSTGWGSVSSLNSTQLGVVNGQTMISRTVTPTALATQYRISCRDSVTNTTNIQSVTIDLYRQPNAIPDLDIQASASTGTANHNQSLLVPQGENVTIRAIRRSGGSFSSCTLTNNRSSTSGSDGWNRTTSLNSQQMNVGAGSTMFTTTFAQTVNTVQYTITCLDALTNTSVNEMVEVVIAVPPFITPVCTIGVNCPVPRINPGQICTLSTCTPPPTPPPTVSQSQPNYRLDATSGSLRATSPGSLSIQAGLAVTLTLIRTNPGTFTECTLITNSINTNSSPGWEGISSLTAQQLAVANGETMISRTVTPTALTTQYQVSCRDTLTNSTNTQSVTVDLYRQPNAIPDLDIQASASTGTASDGQSLTIPQGQSVTIRAIRRSGGSFDSCTLTNNRSAQGWNNITTLNTQQMNVGAGSTMFTTTFTPTLESVQYTVTCRDALTDTLVTEMVKVTLSEVTIEKPDLNIQVITNTATGATLTANDGQILTIPQGQSVTLRSVRAGGGSFESCTLTNSQSSTGWNGTTTLSPQQRNVGSGSIMFSTNFVQTAASVRYTITCDDAASTASIQEVVEVRVGGASEDPTVGTDPGTGTNPNPTCPSGNCTPPPPSPGIPGFQISAVGALGVAGDKATLTVRDGEVFTLKSVRTGGGAFTGCTLSNTQNENEGWGGKTSLGSNELNPSGNLQMITVGMTQRISVVSYRMICKYNNATGQNIDTPMQSVQVRVINPSIEEF